MNVTVRLSQDWLDRDGNKVYMATGDQIREEYGAYMLTALEQCGVPLDLESIRWSWWYNPQEFCGMLSVDADPL